MGFVFVSPAWRRCARLVFLLKAHSPQSTRFRLSVLAPIFPAIIEAKVSRRNAQQCDAEPKATLPRSGE